MEKNVPKEIKKDLIPILEKIVGDSELSKEEITGTVEHLKNVLPPYTYYHYQNLHKTLSNEVFEKYKSQDYFGAVFEGVKRYIQEVKNKTNEDLKEIDLLEKVFAKKSPLLSVTKKYKQPNGTEFSIHTKTNINEGHRRLVLAIWQAFRNPISHSPVRDLQKSGLYTEQDCLDALGLLSHLFRRLDNSELS